MRVIELGAHVRLSIVAGRNGQRGFTLVELITVMVIVGILAVAVLPRFFDKNTFDARGFHDQVISTVRYAQKVAIAQHRFVCVDTSTIANTISLSQGTTNACGTPLASLSSTGNFSIPAPSGVTLTAANFNFDALGKPSASSCIAVSGNNTIKVEAETGFVHSVAVCP